MQKIDMAFLKKQITGGTNASVPKFFIGVFSAIIVMMLIGSIKSPHDVQVATWGICAGLALVCVVICGIIPLLNNKKNSDELSLENIQIKKRVARERYITNDNRWVAFDGEQDDYIVSMQFYSREFAVGREFYIIERVQQKNGKKIEKLIGIYPTDIYVLDGELTCCS